MKILFLSRWFPYPADNGSKIRIFNLLRQLSREHQLDLLSFTAEPVSEEQLRGLSGICRNVAWSVYRPFQPDRLSALAGFFSPTPRSLIDTFNPDFDHLVRAAAANEKYDVLIASQIDMIPYAAALRGIPVRVFEEVELTTLYEQYAGQHNLVKKARSLLTWRKLCSYLSTELGHFQGATVASQQEFDRLRAAVPAFKTVTVIPNGVDLEYLRGEYGPREPGALLYNGALTYSANFDAVAYFLGEIFPLIRQEYPGAKLYVTGKTEGVRLQDLPQQPGVIFTGYLRDIRSRVATAQVSIAPLRQGGGTRLKILESMALGTPVVATRKGAEGLNVSPGKDLFIADSPAGFAAAVLRLLTDPQLRDSMCASARQTVVQQYDWQIIGAKLNQFLQNIVIYSAGNH